MQQVLFHLPFTQSWSPPEGIPVYQVCASCGEPLKELIHHIQITIERRVHERLREIQL